MFSMYAQENQKAIFLAPQDPKNTYYSNKTIFFAQMWILVVCPVNPRQKWVHPPQAGNPPHLLACGWHPNRGDNWSKGNEITMV